MLRPTDCVLAHNKIVTQCRAAAGQHVALSEVSRLQECHFFSRLVGPRFKKNDNLHIVSSQVVQQLEGLAKTVGLNLAGPRCEDEVEGSVLVYNLAVAKFQQRHMLQVSCQDYNC